MKGLLQDESKIKFSRNVTDWELECNNNAILKHSLKRANFSHILESWKGKHCCNLPKDKHENIRFFLKHNFCIKPYVPREPWRDPSNRRLYEHGIWYIFDTARNRTRNLFRPKYKPIPLGHSDRREIKK